MRVFCMFKYDRGASNNETKDFKRRYLYYKSPKNVIYRI